MVVARATVHRSRLDVHLIALASCGENSFVSMCIFNDLICDLQRGDGLGARRLSFLGGVACLLASNLRAERFEEDDFRDLDMCILIWTKRRRERDIPVNTSSWAWTVSLNQD